MNMMNQFNMMSQFMNNQMSMINAAKQLQNNLQQQMNDNNFNFNQNNNQDNQKINLKFQKGKYKISIQCLYSEKFSEAIKKYRIKSGDEDEKDQFFLNAKMLSPELTLAELNLLDNFLCCRFQFHFLNSFLYLNLDLFVWNNLYIKFYKNYSFLNLNFVVT